MTTETINATYQDRLHAALAEFNLTHPKLANNLPRELANLIFECGYLKGLRHGYNDGMNAANETVEKLFGVQPQPEATHGDG